MKSSDLSIITLADACEMNEALVSAFKRCGFDLAEESVQNKVQGLLESLDVDPSWAAKHYEIFQTRYFVSPASNLPPSDNLEITQNNECGQDAAIQLNICSNHSKCPHV